MSTEADDTGGHGSPEGREPPPTGLIWGLKRSFLGYLWRLPDAAHAETEGASLVRSSLFHFANADGSTFDPTTGRGILKFRGAVRLAAHGNLLFVLIADPWVEFGPDRAVLSIVDIEHWPDRNKRLPLATLRATSAPETTRSAHVWNDVRTYLTDEARWVFNDQYPAGMELDPLIVAVPR